MTPTFFEKQNDFRKWLKKNHKIENELLVGFYKVGSKNPSMTWSQSVDEALCFGWIDGVRKSIDKDSYQIRFTPRKLTSIWSAVNIQKIETLTKLGLMKTAGLEIFENRKENESQIYSDENAEVKFSIELEKRFRENKIAWEYFQSLALSYRKHSTYWVMSAKQETTKLKRLHELIADSQAQKNKFRDNKYNKK
jgi:uncharacterized protein YdeI (YjbR/CyaY-like superfamily)